MARVVLRVRLISGDHLDVTYGEPDLEDEHEIIEHVISILASELGALRVRHNDRVMVLFARGIASIEVAPLGPVL